MLRSSIRQFILGLILAVGGFSQSDELRVEKAIPIIEKEKSGGPLVAYREEGTSLTIVPATAFSQQPVEGGITNLLQQQMNLAVVQSLTSWLSLSYGGGMGFRTQEIQVLRQEDQESGYLILLNRPALSWKPREGVEVEAAYESQQSMSNQLATAESGAAILQGKVKMNPKTTLGLGYRDETKTAENGVETDVNSVRLTSEFQVPAASVTLQFNPGYEDTTTMGEHAIRAFVESAVIWKVDSATTLTIGTGFAGGAIASSSGYLLLQHVVIPGTAFELKAAMLSAERDLPGEGFAVSAGSTVALAQALSAGLSLRYKMDENPVVDRPASETFLSLSVNGRF